MRAELLRRVQIGLIGLISVLLLVGLANMALDRARDDADPAVTPATAPVVAAGTGGAAPKEPLAEIGLTPAPADEPTAANGVTRIP